MWLTVVAMHRRSGNDSTVLWHPPRTVALLPQPNTRKGIMMIDEEMLARVLAAGHGCTSHFELRCAGFTRAQVDGLIKRKRLGSVGNGVLRSAAHPETFEQRVAIACRLTNGAATFPTSGLTWQVRKTPRVSQIHILIDWRRHIAAPDGVVLHRSRDVQPRDLVRRRDGIVVVNPMRSAFEAAAFLCADELESHIEDCLHKGYFTIPTAWDAARRLCHPCRPGSRMFLDVLSRREAWRRPVMSDYELRFAAALTAAGLPEPERQPRLTLVCGDVIHPDLGWPDLGFFVEVDHVSWHGGRAENAYDRWRDRQAMLAGATIVRVTDVDIDRRLPATVADVAGLLSLHRGG